MGVIFIYPDYQSVSADMYIHGLSDNRGVSNGASIAWDAMCLDQKLPFLVRNRAILERYKVELEISNAAIPLSPLVSLPAPPTMPLPATSVNEPSDWGAWGDAFRYNSHVRSRGLQLWNRYRTDHPQACGGSIVPTPIKSFRFLDLRQK